MLENKMISDVGLCSSASRAFRPGEPAGAETRPPPSGFRIGGKSQSLKPREAAQPDFGCAACHSGGAVQQPLCFALKLKPGVLMRLAARKCSNPLHEVEQAFRRAAFLMQDGLDDFCRL